MEASRQPCPACRESIDPEARRCPHCRSDVLFDVTPAGPVTDGRERYRAARALAPFASGHSFLDLQRVLTSGQEPVLSGVTRGQAERAAEAAAPLELRITAATAEPQRSQMATREGLPRWVYAVAGLGALIGLFLVLRSNDPQPTTGAGDPTAAVTETDPALETPEIADLALPGTASLRCKDSVGSGFFVSPDQLLTNAHVLCEGGDEMSVHLSDGRVGRGQEVRRDERLDLALVQVSGVEGKPLKLGDAGSLRVGDLGVMIGSPIGLEFTVHEGRVSNLDRIIMGVAFLQVDARVNSGNSGGPLLDSRGRVVGVISLKATEAEGIGLALPINYAFADPSPFVVSPLDPPSAGFARMRASADTQDQQMANELRAAGQRPGLTGVRFSTEGLMVAIVTWPSAQEPFEKNLRFNLLKGGVAVCEIPGQVTRWTKLESASGESVLPTRTREWLERHGFASQMWVTSVRLDWLDCANNELGNDPSGIELELQGADSDAARIPLA